MDMVTAFRCLRHSRISRVASLALALINFSTASMFVTVTAVADEQLWYLSSKRRLPRLNSPKQKNDRGSRRSILAKRLLQILKGFLLMYALHIVFITELLSNAKYGRGGGERETERGRERARVCRCVCRCVCSVACVRACVCVCAVSYTHLTLPTRR